MVLTLAFLVILVTGSWSFSAVEAPPTPVGITREGTISAINPATSSFVLSMASGNPRRVTVFVQKFTQMLVARQGRLVPVAFGSLAVGDRIAVNMLTLDNGPGDQQRGRAVEL